MARAILLVAAFAWLVAGATALGVAAFATPRLEALLPPLIIDTDALRATIVALGLGLLAVAAVHAVVLVGLARGARWASTVAILLGAVFAAALLALAAAAVTSAAATPEHAPMFVAATAVAAVAAAGYAVAAVRLVAERRSGSAF